MSTYSNVHVRYPYLTVDEVEQLVAYLTSDHPERTVVPLDSREWFTLHSDHESVKIDVASLSAICNNPDNIESQTATNLKEMRFLYDEWIADQRAERETGRPLYCEIAVLNPFMSETDAAFVVDLLGDGVDGRSVIISDSHDSYHQKFRRRDVVDRAELLAAASHGDRINEHQRRLIESDLIDAAFWLSTRSETRQLKIGDDGSS